MPTPPTDENNLTDLNSHLFAQLDRLGKKEQTADELTTEINRSNAIIGVAKEIIHCGRLQLDAIELRAEYHGITRTDNMQGLIEKKP